MEGGKEKSEAEVEGKMEAELREGMQAWRKQHPKATLDEIETELNRQVALLRAAVLAETVATSKAVKAEEEVVCPVCGTKMVREGQHKRKLKTYGGQALELVREYVRCPRCGQGFFPLDRELELLDGEYTPQVYGWMARLSGWMPFTAAAKMTTALLGVAVSEPTVRRVGEAVGAAYVALQSEQTAELERDAPPAPAGAARMVVSADGAMVPLLHGEWGEVRTLAIGAVVKRAKPRSAKRRRSTPAPAAGTTQTATSTTSAPKTPAKDSQPEAGAGKRGKRRPRQKRCTR